MSESGSWSGSRVSAWPICTVRPIVFTLGSLKEMNSVALLEATASGLPCVVHRSTSGHAVGDWPRRVCGGSVAHRAVGSTGDGAAVARIANNEWNWGDWPASSCVQHFDQDRVGRIGSGTTTTSCSITMTRNGMAGRIQALLEPCPTRHSETSAVSREAAGTVCPGCPGANVQSRGVTRETAQHPAFVAQFGVFALGDGTVLDD